MNDRSSFVIIGASHGGVHVAASLRERGFTGRVHLISAEPDLPYHRPPLSKAFLKDPDSDLQVLRPRQFYDEHDIALRLGVRASEIDRAAGRVRLDDGSTLAFDRLCLATGARARSLPIGGMDADNVHVLRAAGEARTLRRAAAERGRTVVIGGGFIGLEAAASMNALGHEVTVVEAAPRLMGRAVAPEISAHVQERLEQLGITIHLDAPADEILTRAGVAHAVRAGDLELPADLVLVGVGVEADTGLAAASGLVCDNGVRVDGRLRTSDPAVFAIGDLANYDHWLAGGPVRLESVQNAVDQGRHVGAVIAGAEEAYGQVPWFWSDQADMKLQMAGLSHRGLERVVRGDPASGRFSVFHYAGEELVAVDSVNSPADHMVARRLIGAGLSPDPRQAGDAEFALKSLLG